MNKKTKTKKLKVWAIIFKDDNTILQQPHNKTSLIFTDLEIAKKALKTIISFLDINSDIKLRIVELKEV